MKQFGEIYPSQTQGQLTMFDRILFKGHLSGLYPADRFGLILYHQAGTLLKEYKAYAQKCTEQLKAHLQEMAQVANRPVQYLRSGYGAEGESKEQLARAIAERDNIEQGLIAIFSALEMNQTFSVRGERETGQIHMVAQRRKQLHFYVYYQDDEFGFMYLRIQSWWPYEIQIYINGHEWLGRQLDQVGVGYQRVDNCFWLIDDLAQAQKLCEKFAHRKWERVWNAFAERHNPLLEQVQAWTGKGYYWSINQAEIATDVIFSDQGTLDEWLPDLFQEALLVFSAEDVMRFLGRKLHGNFQGQVQTHLNQRQPGWRVKHWVKQNSLKMYNKGPVLRVETTINKSREFKIPAPPQDSRRWKGMPKGVPYFWHFYQIGQQANQRYLDALGHIPCQGKAAHQALDSLCQSQEENGRRVAKFQPVDQDTSRLFASVLRGEYLLTGFRNHHLRASLFDTPPRDKQEEHRRRARVSRLLAKLRGHGLIEQVQRAHVYRVTTYGTRVMAAALCYRYVQFPAAFAFS